MFALFQGLGIKSDIKAQTRGKIFYPNDILYQFLKQAQNRRDPIGYVAGYKKDEFLIATEVILPDQLCLNSKIKSNLDKKDFGKFCTLVSTCLSYYNIIIIYIIL